MKQSLPITRLIVLVVILGGVGAAWYFINRSAGEDWIATPIIEPFDENVTVQWEMRPVGAEELSISPTNHPGYQLAQQHCVRCHLLPTPDQLPRESWPFALTWMANYLGYRNLFGPFRVNVDESLIPPQPLVSRDEFRAISDYYNLLSKSELEVKKILEERQTLNQFEIASIGPNLPRQTLITLVHYDESQQRYYLGSGSAKALAIYDHEGRLLEGVNVESEPIDIEIIPDGFRLSLIGDLILDERGGKVAEFSGSASGEASVVDVVTNYHRLTQTLSEDLNGDGEEDLLLIGFGQGELGKVSIFWRGKDGTVLGEKVLIDHSGALNAVIHDFNDDSREDIMVLTAQGRQELLLFLNQGQGRFDRRLIHKQFAGFGNNHLEIGDFNLDGLMDVLIVNGNNMEMKDAPLKSYHGIRIYENKGNLEFEEKFFIRFDGALKALVEDFDQDGDLDVAAISFYPDWASDNPETFLYLENRGSYEFAAFRLTRNDWGRWISMGVADVDGDGLKDILLGGGYTPFGVSTRYTTNYNRLARDKRSLVILRNTSRNEE